MTCHAPEAVLSGPAGTGKTRAGLEKVHLAALKYPRMRALLLRKTHVSLTATALVTWREKVLHRLDGVIFYGGSAEEPPQYRYANGSRVMLGGLDPTNVTRIMSGEYDLIYVVEATELREPEWELLTTRARYGVMPYQQVMGDCNPDAPQHWLKRRAEAGKATMLESRHEDNPTLWDAAAGDWTPFGAAYIARLDGLTGVRYHRLRRGLWVAAEGLVYDGWDPALHLVDRFPIPADWPRYWVCDFGFTNPFVWQAWAMDPDGRLYRYREICRTQRLVEDHARDILALTAGEPRPRAIICDHDAEGRATLEKYLGMRTTPARKAIAAGIQDVAGRLKPAGDGRPRLLLVRDSLDVRDEGLAERELPTCTEDEFPEYVWDTSAGRRKGETPVDLNNHGMDCTRYLAAHIDQARRKMNAA